MIPGFEDGIKGHKAGEEFTIDVTFPEEYHAENLKGKAAKFVINLKKVEERELPELTEEFIKRFGVEDGSVAGLRAEVRKNMERELKGAVRNRVKSQAIEGLVKANEIDVPAALIDSEIDVLLVRLLSVSAATRNRLWNCRASCSKSRLNVASLLVCCWAK
ncbi:cell division trigger factor [Klebsiella pneumoniae]|uniref:Peptidyl-prolyl cis-trans isomerase n=1 Tax=Klebsiella pneumoniae TaxID=573 RepID=A0A2X3DGY4_KLEPN|nr:cell division trigger factor [Klebsiella pneumoniae]